MYTVSEDRPRGSSAGQSSREFPVLFHLMDVSRPRVSQQAPTIDSANLLSAVEQLRWPPNDDSETSQTNSAAQSVPPAPEPEATLPTAEIPATSPLLEAASSALEAEVVATETGSTISENVATNESDPAAPNEPEQDTSALADVADPVVASPTTHTAVSPASPLVSLRKRRKPSASEDWFASHGKYIAVAFVLSLVATIYFARVNRERNTIAKQETPSQPPLNDTTTAVASTNQTASSSASATSAVQTVSAAAPATPSPVELRAPQLVESSSEKSKDNLFQFAGGKNPDDRIAARSDDPSKSAAPALTTPGATAPAPTASVFTAPAQPNAPEVIAAAASQPASSTAPAEATAYPATTSPASQYPVSIPPAAAYPTTSPSTPSAPVLAPPSGSSYQPYQPQSQYGPPAGAPTDYRNQYPVTPASSPPQQPAAQAWNAGQPASYPSYDSTARGPRNERTGSGTY